MNNIAGEKRGGRTVPMGVNPIPPCSAVSVKDFADLQAVVLGSQEELHQVEQPVTVRKK